MSVKTLLAGLVIGLLLGVYVYQEVLDGSEVLDALRDAYDELGDTYGDLVADFYSLRDSYDEVYDALQEKIAAYTVLLSEHEALQVEYEELQSIVEDLVDSPTQNGDAGSISRNRYWVSYTLDITSSGSGNIRLYWAVPEDTSYQEVVSVSYNEEVEHYQLDDHGNLVAYFVLGFNPGETRELTLTCTVDSLYGVEASQSMSSTVYDAGSDIYTKYTRDDVGIEAADYRIVSKAAELTAGIYDPSEKARVIQEWVHDNVDWTGFSSSTRGAVWALENGVGDCTEFATLFIALCRASGVPARLVDGVSKSSLAAGGSYSWSQVGHDWAEVYLPGAGWVQADPTYGWYDGGDGVRFSFQHGSSSSVFTQYYRYIYYTTGSSFDIVEEFTILLVD